MKVALVLLTLFAGSTALACKPAPPTAFAASDGSSDAPPQTRLASAAVSLGPAYGRAGAGDCSDLGTVELLLEAPDGSTLDGRFGAKVLVTAGALPALVDLSTFVAAIQRNRVSLRIAGDTPTVDFTVAVQLVNALGQLGAPSAAVHQRRSAGCSAAGEVSVLALVALARARRRRPERRAHGENL